jgi:DNA-binding response OmpR family regulator
LRILIVDDSTVMRKLLGFLLSHIKGVRVTTANDGLEGLRLAREFGPHVIILDVSMPYKSGLEVLDEIRKNDQSSTIIMFTADPSPRTRELCLRAGANFFLDKVSEFDRLIAICETKALAS